MTGIVLGIVGKGKGFPQIADCRLSNGDLGFMIVGPLLRDHASRFSGRAGGMRNRTPNNDVLWSSLRYEVLV